MEKACVDVYEGHNKNGLTCLRLCIIVSVNANDTIFHFIYLTRQHALSPLTTVAPTKSDSDAMFCLQSYQGLAIDKSLVY